MAAGSPGTPRVTVDGFVSFVEERLEREDLRDGRSPGPAGDAVTVVRSTRPLHPHRAVTAGHVCGSPRSVPGVAVLRRRA